MFEQQKPRDGRREPMPPTRPLTSTHTINKWNFKKLLFILDYGLSFNTTLSCCSGQFSLGHIPIIGSCNYFLLELYFFSAFWDCKMLHVHFIYFLSLFENQFLQSPNSFHQRTTQGAKIKGLGYGLCL